MKNTFVIGFVNLNNTTVRLIVCSCYVTVIALTNDNKCNF